MNWRRVTNLFVSWFYYLRNRSTPYRNALFYLVLTTIFSLLPLIAGGLTLWLFHKWNGNRNDWKELLQGGDLLVASACLMASSLWTLRRGGKDPGFLRMSSWGIAIVVIALDCIVYAAVVVQSKNLLKEGIALFPEALMISSIALYFLGLVVGFHALVIDYKPLPTPTDVQQEQVQTLERQLENL
jgi:peptidoglycan biosynthesis protein MviN/MurJ (putative lipid II flippase)